MSEGAAVGELNEGPLHAALKDLYRQAGDRVEVPLEGFVIDLVRGDALIEIQTGGFSAMRRKLDHLLDRFPVTVVHPIAATRWVVREEDDGTVRSRRRSPKHGIPADVCAELVSFPSLVSHPHFTLELAMVHEDEVRRADATRGWRRGGWVVHERRLLDVVDRLVLARPADLLALLPPGLPPTFTTADLASGLGRPRRLAQSVAYCLRTAEVIDEVGRDRAGVRYRLAAR